ncbi:cytochrome P450 [Sorangium sp. So ce726]|uniref:cytochrome P450 n=1 Tax=Sorangium sp. So ce726 TaxID=3133319 RepID=UPI003F636E74
MNDHDAVTNLDFRAVLTKPSPEFFADPYSFYQDLREAGPIQWVSDVFGVGAWLVSSHGLCSSLLRSRSFGMEAHKVLPPGKLLQFLKATGKPTTGRRGSMLFHDPPDHTRLRGLVSRAFTPQTIERRYQQVTEIASQLLDDVKDREEIDIIADYAFPLPVVVIAELLGVPVEDRDLLKRWSADLVRGYEPGASPEEFARYRQASSELDGYLNEIVELRRRAPRADLVSELIQVQEAGDRLSMQELTATCSLLLIAGHENTMNLVGNGTLALVQHPDARRALASEPELIGNTIEELLRYDSPGQVTLRFCLEETAVGGHTVRRGDLVVLVLGAANRDPVQFADPDRLDVHRDNAASHLSLGAGIHYCLGAPLSRLEGQIAIDLLFRRFPRLTAETQGLAWHHNIMLRGLQSLPITLSSA